MPIILNPRPLTSLEGLRERSLAGPNAPDPLLAPKQPPRPGFIETAWASFRTNSITGTLGQEIGHAIWGDQGGEREEDFDPYKEFLRDKEFMAEHHYLWKDFESGRMDYIPNRQAFFYFVARKQEDYELRQLAGRRGGISGFAANMLGIMGPDAGIYAVTGGGAVKGVAPFRAVSVKVADWLAKGNTATRIAKGAAIGSVANVTNEGVLEFINPDRNVDEMEAFLDAAVWGAAFGAAIPLGGKVFGAGRERLMDTRFMRDLQLRVKTAIAKTDAISDLPKIMARQSDELDSLLAEAPTGPKVITPLVFPDNLKRVDAPAGLAGAADTAGAAVDDVLGDAAISAQMRENGVKVEKLKKKYAEAGQTLDIQPHPYQDYLNLTVSLNDLDAMYRSADPSGIVGKGAAFLNSFLPGGKARAMPSAVARFFNYTLFDDAALLMGNIVDPVNFKNNPSAESLKAVIGMHFTLADQQIGQAFKTHFKKGERFTVRLSDGTELTVGRWKGYKNFRHVVTDLMRQEAEIARGARNKLSFEPPAAVREAADVVRQYSKDMLDRLDQAKLLKGPSALKAAQEQLSELEQVRAVMEDARAEHELTRPRPPARETTVDDVLAASSDTSKGHVTADYRIVDDVEAQRIKDAIGLDVSGYTHSLDQGAVGHILKQHGGESERLRGQIPITKDDIARIPEIVAEPDLIEHGGKTKDGLPSIRYRKRFNGTTYYVEEVRMGKKRLAPKTMWKVATGATDASNPRAVLTPEATPASPPSPTTIQSAGTKVKDNDLGRVEPKRATIRSAGYKRAYKQRLAELEEVMPSDPANAKTAREIALQDVQQRFDESAAKANADIDAYLSKRAEIEKKARTTDEQINAAKAEIAEIEELIANSHDYLTRRWLRHKIEGDKDNFTGLLKKQWRKNRTHEYKTGQAKAERPIIDEALDRLTPDDRALIRAAGDEAKISLEDGLRDRYEAAVSQYFHDSAENVYRTLTNLNNSHGVQAAMGADSLKGRVLQIDETAFRQYLDQDIQSILGNYDHQLSGRAAVRIAIDNNAATWAPLVKQMTGETFDGSLDQIQRAVREHFDKMINAADGDAAKAKIKKARDQMEMIIERKVSELEGRPAIAGDGSAADAGWRALGRAGLRLPYLTTMGNMLITNLMDLAGLVLMTGLDGRKIKLLASVFKREDGGFLPGVSKRGLEAVASALDQTGIRNMQLNEVFDHPHDVAPAVSMGGKALQMLDQGTGFLANQFGVVSGMNWLNTTTRRMASHLILDEVVNGAKKMSKARKLIAGGMTEAKAFHQVGLALEDAQRMSRLGFNADKCDELVDVLTKNAVDFDGAARWTDRDGFMNHKGHINPEYEKWYHTDRDMFDRFTAAINSEVNNIIVAPKSLSRPFMNARWIGRAVNQFWSFANAWSNQLAVVVGQRPGGEQALYFASIVGLAAISDGIHNHLSGRRSFDETAALWSDPKTSMAMAYKAIDRSGVLGWLSRPLGIADRHNFGPSDWLGGDNVSSRYSGNTASWAGHFGPVIDYSERLGRGLTGVPSKGDVRSWHTLRTTIPFQNLLGINAIFRATKDMGLDNPFGPGNGLDLFPLPTRPAYELNRVEREPEP